MSGANIKEAILLICPVTFSCTSRPEVLHIFKVLVQQTTYFVDASLLTEC